MTRRTDIRNAFTTAIVAAATPVAGRLYPGRTKALATKAAADAVQFPAAALFIPDIDLRAIGLSPVYEETTTIVVEVFVKDAGGDLATEEALDLACDPIVDAVLLAAGVRDLFEKPVGVKTVHGIEANLGERLAAATIMFTGTLRREIAPHPSGEPTPFEVHINTDLAPPDDTIEVEQVLGPFP